MGTYRIQVLVNDGFKETLTTYTVDVGSANQPSADVSLSESQGHGGIPIRLDGSRSSDPTGSDLTYAWEIIDHPTGANAVIADPTSAATTFTVNAVGFVRVRLTVDNGSEVSAPVTFRVDVDPNRRPNADLSLSENAGVVGIPIKLDGTRSADPEGQPLTFSWTVLLQPEGSAANIADPAAPATTISVDAPGQYRVRLIVNDGVNEDWAHFLIHIRD